MSRSPRPLLLAAALAASAAPASSDGPWSIETVGGAISLDISIAVDPQGVPHIVHNDGAEPRLARRTGGVWYGERLATPFALSVADSVGDGGEPERTSIVFYVAPSLALDPATGEPRIAYAKYGSHVRDIWYAEKTSGVWSYHRLSMQADGDAPPIAIDDQGRPHVAFSDYGAGPRYAIRTAGVWTTESVAAGGAPGSLALDAVGRPRLSGVLIGANSDLIYGERDGAWSFERADTAGNTGMRSSLKLDAAGEPHVSYYDATLGAIRYAFRNGGVWTTETVTAPGGACNALALDLAGRPCVAYYDRVAGDLRFARRDAGVWTTESVESAGDVGSYCALAIDHHGRPHIGYYDTTNRRVRYATSGLILDAAVGAVPGFRLERLWSNPLPAGRPLELALRLDGPRTVALELLDLAGRRVAAHGAIELGAGAHSIRWPIAAPAPGLYLIRARTDRGEVARHRIAMVR